MFRLSVALRGRSSARRTHDRSPFRTTSLAQPQSRPTGAGALASTMQRGSRSSRLALKQRRLKPMQRSRSRRVCAEFKFVSRATGYQNALMMRNPGIRSRSGPGRNRGRDSRQLVLHAVLACCRWAHSRRLLTAMHSDQHPNLTRSRTSLALALPVGLRLGKSPLARALRLGAAWPRLLRNVLL